MNMVVSSTTSTLANNLTFDPSGALLTRTLNPNGSVPTIETFSYNHRMQQTQVRAAQGSTYVMDFSYNYGTTNNVGQLLSRTDAIQHEHSVNYSYDSIYRLSQVLAQDTSWSISWTFDAWSNRLTQSASGYVASANIVGSQNLAYSNNRLTGITNLTYDAAGNLTNEGTGGHTYTYNGKNQITRIDGSGSDNYIYDGEGRRAKKTIGGVSTFYFYGPGGIISEFTTTSGATGASTSDKTNYQTSNRQGTAALLIAASGLIVENNRTLPYGELWSPQVSSATTKKYTTYERDAESNLDYAINRYVSNVYGRFQSIDKGGVIPHQPTSLNRYIYAMNDPVNGTDPDGNIMKCDFGFVRDRQGLATGCLPPPPPPMPGSSREESACWELAPGGCDGGEEGGGGAPQTDDIPALNGTFTAAELAAYNAGMRMAIDMLDPTKRGYNQTCADALGAEIGALDSLRNASWQFGDLGVPTIQTRGAVTSFSATHAATNPVTGSVTINSFGGFVNSDTYTATGQFSNLMGFPGDLNHDQVRALIILHEVGHLSGRFHKDAGPGVPANASQNNTNAVIQNCFRQ